MRKEIKNTGTKFKIVVYWKIKKDGFTPYSEAEIKAKQNRKFIPSYDYTVSAGGVTIENHELALQKQYTFLDRRKNFFTAYIIWNVTEGVELAVSKHVEGKIIHARPAVFYKCGAQLKDIKIKGLGGKEILLNGTASQGEENKIGLKVLRKTGEQLGDEARNNINLNDQIRTNKDFDQQSELIALREQNKKLMQFLDQHAPAGTIHKTQLEQLKDKYSSEKFKPKK